jgi:hypothetical protein
MSTAQQITAQKLSPKVRPRQAHYAVAPSNLYTLIYTTPWGCWLFLDTKKAGRACGHADPAASSKQSKTARPWRSYLEVDVAGDGGGVLEEAVGRVRRRAEGLDLFVRLLVEHLHRRVVRDVLVFQAAVRGGVDDVVVVVEAEPAGALREAATRRCRGCDVLLAEHVAFDGAAAADRLIEKPARTVAE